MLQNILVLQFPQSREKMGSELEQFLDLLQPGWREVLVKKRPLPNMVVCNAVVTAADGGLHWKAAYENCRESICGR